MARPYDPDKKFGFVLFDDIKDPSSGWASIAGGNATRIATIDDLSTGVIWWTNIGYQEFFYSTEIWRKSFLRHDRYLVVSPDRALAEWNTNPKTASPDYKCVFLAQVFNRVMYAAFNLARKQIPAITMEKLFGGQKLADDLRILMPEMDYPRGEAAAVMKADLSFSYFTKSLLRMPSDGDLIILRKPRLLYAQTMLNFPVPVGPFEPLSRRTMREMGAGDDRAQFIREADKPYMVELTIERMNPDLGPIYNFSGSNDKNKKKVNRNWVAHPEFLCLDTLADVDVRSAYVGDRYTNLYEGLDENITDFLNDIMNDSLWSSGIIAETLWQCMLLKEASDRIGRAADGDEKAGTSWEGAWLRAHDKIVMFAHAKELTQMSYAVSSYGPGWIMCKVPREMRNDFLRDSLSLGLVPAMTDFPEGLFDRKKPIPWTNDKKSIFLATLQAQRRHNAIWLLDQLSVVDDPKQRKELQNQIMAKVQQMGW